MAIAFVQSKQVGTTGGATSSIGLDAASAAGNTLVLQVSTAIGRPTNGGDPYVNVTSNISGTTFTRATSASILQSDIYYEHSQIWIASNVPAGAHTVTVNAGTGAEDYGQLFLIEFSGLANASVVDLTGNKIGDSTLGQLDTTINAGTTTQSEELILAAFSAGGATNLNDYFTTEIVTPSGFTPLALDTNARQGNRALSHSYKIVNAAGPQAVSWGTIADPGQTEKLVWAANVAALKATVTALTVPGVTLTAPASLVSGTSTAVRRATPAGLVFSRAASLISGTGVGGRNAAASMVDGAPTGTVAATASFVSGNAVGVPLNTIGGINFTANTSIAAGTPTASRQANSVGVTYNSAATLSVGVITAQHRATPSGVLLVSTASLIAGQNTALSNAVVNGVSFLASASVVSQNLTFTFDSTSQPTFDRDNGYTFDAALIGSSNSAVPFGAIFARQSSLVPGSVTSTQFGLAGNIILPVVTTVLMATPAIVAVDAIPGNFLVVPVSFVQGVASAQSSTPIDGFTGVSTTNLITGNAASTLSAAPAGEVLESAASIIAGSTDSQISRVVSGSTLIGLGSLTVGNASSTTAIVVAPYTLTASSLIAQGGVIAQKNINIGAAILTSATGFLAGTTNSQTGASVGGYLFGGVATLVASTASGTKDAVPEGRLITATSTLIAGGVNGLLNALATGQTLESSTAYKVPTASSIHAANRTGQTYVVRPELLAGQAASAVNAIVNGQILASNSSLSAGNIVYFGAVEVISQTIATQSAFMAGAAVGKQLTRRNTGGRAFYFLQEFLQPIVGQELIFSDQNGPRPAKPYATLSVRSISEQPIIEHHLNGGGIVSLAKLQRMIVEVEYFGLGAFSKAQVLGLKLESPSSVDRGQEFGVSVSELRGVTRVPELLNQSQYEERAILEFTAYIMVEGDDDVGLIEHAIIQDTDADHACNFDFVYEGPN